MRLTISSFKVDHFFLC